MSDKEKFYDEHISEKLIELSELCGKEGINFLARVEYGEDMAAIIRNKAETRSISQDLAIMAALCRGNLDNLCISVLKKFGKGGSIFLNKF